MYNIHTYVYSRSMGMGVNISRFLRGDMTSAYFLKFLHHVHALVLVRLLLGFLKFLCVFDLCQSIARRPSGLDGHSTFPSRVDVFHGLCKSSTMTTRF